MVSISVVGEGGARRIRILDEATGASEDVILSQTGVAGDIEPVNIRVEDEDDLSGRHHYSP